MDQVVEKEITETTASLAQQHAQCQWYVQTYLVAIAGLFAVAAFFGKDGHLSIQASAIGATYSLIVFFLGWIFLSVIAHKAAMIHMLYKHIAAMRGLRIAIHAPLRENYVLPRDRGQIKYGALLTQLPYIFFAFNFVFLCGAFAYFLAPHFAYFQTVAVICAAVVFLGTLYPVVCISFNKHLGCAFKARNIDHRYLLEHTWTRAVRDAKRKYRFLRFGLLAFANLGAIAIAVISFTDQGQNFCQQIVWASYIGVAIFGLVRFAIEKIRIKIGVKAVRQRIA